MKSKHRLIDLEYILDNKGSIEFVVNEKSNFEEIIAKKDVLLGLDTRVKTLETWKESGINARLLNDLSWGDFFIKRYHTVNLEGLSSSNFYPIFFDESNIELDCEIHSPDRSSQDPYNQNRLHFYLTSRGWSDTQRSLSIISQNNYDNKEITIGSIGCGTTYGGIAIWVRGGMTYRLCSNKIPKLKTSSYTYGSGNNAEIYTVGTNLWGGGNTRVTIVWKNDDTRDNAVIVTKSDNIASATKLQIPRNIFGQSFDGSSDINGNLITNGSITAHDVIKSGSSDEYVLLGGGGHKKLSEIGGGRSRSIYLSTDDTIKDFKILDENKFLNMIKSVMNSQPQNHGYIAKNLINIQALKQGLDSEKNDFRIFFGNPSNREETNYNFPLSVYTVNGTLYITFTMMNVTNSNSNTVINSLHIHISDQGEVITTN